MTTAPLTHRDLGIHPGILGQILEAGNVAWPCGVCRDCHDRANSQELPGGPLAWGYGRTRIAFHAFEPVRGNQAALELGVGALLAEHPHSDVSFTLHRTAVVGDASITSVSFGDCMGGEEGCGLGNTGPSGNMTRVNATTLDAWALAWRIPVVDILVIDAEGFEPDIFAGSLQLFRSGKVRLFVFEYGGRWPLGSNSTLQREVATFDSLGYDCYLLQRSLVIRLTGCWVPAMESYYWSNVLCTLRTEVLLHETVERFTPSRQGGRGLQRSIIPKMPMRL